MPAPSLLRRLSALSSQAALLVGLGSLWPLSAQAALPDERSGRDEPGVSRDRSGSFGDLSVRIEDGRIFIAEADGEFRELPLQDTAEARLLAELLAHEATASGPAGMRVSPTVLAGAGGQGYHWTPVPHNATAPSPSSTAGTDAPVNPDGSPRRTSAPAAAPNPSPIDRNPAQKG
jgi:hypothetical protein